MLPLYLLQQVQPLDVGVFTVQKARYEDLIRQYVRLANSTIKRREFISIYKDIYATSTLPRNIKSAFKKAVIQPRLVRRIQEILNQMPIDNSLQLQLPTTPKRMPLPSYFDTPKIIDQVNRLSLSIIRRDNLLVDSTIALRKITQVYVTAFYQIEAAVREVREIY